MHRPTMATVVLMLKNLSLPALSIRRSIDSKDLFLIDNIRSRVSDWLLIEQHQKNSTEYSIIKFGVDHTTEVVNLGFSLHKTSLEGHSDCSLTIYGNFMMYRHQLK